MCIRDRYMGDVLKVQSALSKPRLKCAEVTPGSERSMFVGFTEKSLTVWRNPGFLNQGQKALAVYEEVGVRRRSVSIMDVCEVETVGESLHVVGTYSGSLDILASETQEQLIVGYRELQTTRGTEYTKWRQAFSCYMQIDRYIYISIDICHQP
eukprot:TRINITY_DN9058_c0_g1_i2.p1 TRINITY_DN9058_c0_g1~~TRINITY_DN9058_c0_g1_i2.p1  ORF type:complete len:153 (-),score=16.04 TRINITY_DN9058_c0_g1_i2:21-479(-)